MLRDWVYIYKNEKRETGKLDERGIGDAVCMEESPRESGGLILELKSS